jgi:hypothetical protein
MKKIKLTKNKFAIVDDEDFVFLNQWKWCYNENGYATRGTHKKINGKRISINYSMHRQVNNTPEGFDTDHINQNKLDNRKSNLRTVTHQQNSFNYSPTKNNTSGCRGISWFKRDKKWLTQITLNGKTVHLGYFNKIKDAILARHNAELQYYGV